MPNHLEPEMNMTRRKLLATLGIASIAGVASLAAVGAAPQIAEAASELVFNVKDYGAKGRGGADDNDAISIQAAINAAIQSARGGIVYLPPGKYLLKTPILISSNIRLIGSGINATNLKAGNINMNVITHFPGAENFSIENLTIEGSGPTNGGKNTYVEHGIQLDKINKVTIKDCLLKFLANGIQMMNSYGITVNNCIFEDILGLDGLYEGFGIICDGSMNVIISDNKFKNVYRSCLVFSGGCSYSVATHNLIDSCKEAAILVSSKEAACEGNLITENIITNVTNNTTGGSRAFGIALLDNCKSTIVANNIITSVANSGIKLQGTDDREKGRPCYNKISGNTIRHAGANGILLLNSDDNIVTSNDIRDVEVHGISIDTTGDGVGSFSKMNYIVQNGVSSCKNTGVSIGSINGVSNTAFHNYGAGNGDPFIDKGTSTAKTGF